MPKANQDQRRTVVLSELRPKPLLVAELTWLFSESESAIASPSNLDPSCTERRSGHVGETRVPSDDSIEDRIEAAHAARVIEGRLRAMPRAEALVIFAAFEPRPWTKTLEAAFHPVTGLAVRMSLPAVAPAPRSFAELRQREDAAAVVLERAFIRGGAAAVAALKTRALLAYASALRAYSRVRGPGATVVPVVGR